MKSTLPKVNELTFSQFRTFFNSVRFVDRGVPITINFVGAEQRILTYIKQIIRESCVKHTYQGNNEKCDCEFTHDECTEKNIVIAIRKATDIIMGETLFTECTSNCTKMKKKVWKKTTTEKLPYYRITELPASDSSSDTVKESIIPLSIGKMFSMEMSLILDNSDHSVEEPEIVWETARTRIFADKYINHDTYVKDICGAFKGKSVYTFTQSRNKIVLFPPSCAKQGKAERGLGKLVIWSVHNIISLSLNRVIRDLSPTKSLDRKVAFSHSLKLFLCESAKRQPQVIQDEPKAFALLTEALFQLDGFCELLEKNAGMCLAPYDAHIPRVYTIGCTCAVCSLCCEPTYGTAFYRRVDGKEEFICVGCLGRISDGREGIIEFVFMDDPPDAVPSIQDSIFFTELFEDARSKLSVDPKLEEILMVAEDILPPLSDTFYLNHSMKPRLPYKTTQDRSRRTWGDWEIYFKERINTNPTIMKFLHAKEGMYKMCLPVERFYGNPIWFSLFLFHVAREKELDSITKALHSVYIEQFSAYTMFILKFLECNSGRKFKASEKDLIVMKLLEFTDTKADTQKLYTKNPTNIVLDKEKLSRLCVFQENASRKEKRKVVKVITTKSRKSDSAAITAGNTTKEEEEEEEDEEEEKEFELLEKGAQSQSATEPPLKVAAFEVPKFVRFYPEEFGDGWLTKYATTKLLLSNEAIQRIGEEHVIPLSGASFVEEEYAVDDGLVIHIKNFLVNTNRDNERFFREYKKKLTVYF